MRALRPASRSARTFAAAALLAGAAAVSLPAASAGAAAGPASGTTVTYGVAAATQLGLMPDLEPTAMAGGQSSFDRDTYDPTHGNSDFNNFLSTGPDGNVMLDQTGPGCVYRIWMTSLQPTFPDNWVKIYFDGAATPAIDMTVAQMFSGRNAPFLSPLVQNSSGSSGGYVSYVPLCYKSSIKITTDMDRYYNIGYVTYQPGANVQTWTPGDDTTAMRAEWSNATQDPISTAGSSVTAGTVTLRPQVPRTILDLSGPRSIQSVKIKIPGVTASSGARAESVLNQTWIRMYWDGARSPSVNAPIGSFFAMGQFGSYQTHGLVATGLDASNTMYMYLPMPFAHSAVIQLVNTGRASLTGVKYQIAHRQLTGSLAGTGYFTTSYTTTSPAKVGQDIPILTASGSGKFIGVTASYTGFRSRTYLEGDERIYVDGSGSPAFYGTGTEDFFNGAWYFYRGRYSQPMSGNTAHILSGNRDYTAAYRFFLQDAIPFRRSIVVSIQHGGHDDTSQTTANMLAYYYLRPAVQSGLTDTLSVADPASDKSHGYVISGQDWVGTSSYQYEGTADTVNASYYGRGYTGSSQFTMAITPGNQGVDLRRRYDQGFPSQEADVYVDGQLVGPWLVAGGNIYHRWADTDFIVPASFTAGQKSITVKVAYVSGKPYFTEYAYWAYSITP